MRRPTAQVMRAALAAVALAVVLASTGCTSSNGPTTDGPLGGGPFGGPGGGADCQVTSIGQRVTFADETFTNRGHLTVVLDHLGLLRPHNLRLLGSYAVPGHWMVGERFGWPPKGPQLPPTWPHRRAVPGFRLKPGRRFNIAIGVVATTGPLARTSGMVIRYHDSAGSYVLDNHFAMGIGTSNAQCNRVTP